ncbi:TPA: AAA family ATPase [Campylobacter lari]|nr:AAA family ATPase [Campylobacter lari]
MIEFSNEEREKFKDYLINFFHNAYGGNKFSRKDEEDNFNFLKKYSYFVKLSYGRGIVSKIPWIIFVRMDTQEYKASYGVYVYCGIKRENGEIVVYIGESEDIIINYIAKDKVDEYNTKFNNVVFHYSNLNNDIDVIVDKIIENMHWFKRLPLNEIQDRNALSISNNKEIRNNENEISNKKENQNPPLNQILYGPPGTGKTYHTIDKALEILGENLANKDRDEKKTKFDEYVKNGQIIFTTFHQSYGYEEFVEGIKPRIDSKENSKEVEYEIKDGIFKELCKKALDNYKVSLLTQEEFVKSEDLENKIEIFLDELVDQQKFIEKTQSGGFKLEEYNEKYRIITDDTNANLYLNLEIFKTLLENKDKIINGRSIKQILNNKHRRQIDSYYFQLVKLFKEREQDYKVDNNPSEKPELKPYIIIIDEINRGNVSKIFGELITLIEPSKRIGANEELKVRLPYSKDEFGVPKNVYIIGTMNTADRSITSLDTALRRRFEFVEMMPKLNVLSDNCKGANLQKLLEAINTRIEYLLDREKTIGHAFFIGIDNLDDLKKVFQNKIIPLLQEYFYNDYALIDAVLNKNGMLEKQDINSDYLKNMTDFIESDKVIYKFSDSQKWDETTFKKIYE